MYSTYNNIKIFIDERKEERKGGRERSKGGGKGWEKEEGRRGGKKQTHGNPLQMRKAFHEVYIFFIFIHLFNK